MIIPCHVLKRTRIRTERQLLMPGRKRRRIWGLVERNATKRSVWEALKSQVYSFTFHWRKLLNEAARLSFVNQNINLLQRLGSCPSPFLFPWWPTQSLLWPSTTMMIDFVQFLSIISDDINNNSTAIQLYFNKTQTLKVSGIWCQILLVFHV